MDFKKAFDYVDHNIAIAELMSMGCRASLVPFTTSFLTARRHRVRYEDALSDFAYVTCGVPQGTCAGPIIFLALVNSMCEEIERRAKFVDDLSLGYVISIRDVINFGAMQEDLHLLCVQCGAKHMEANPLKCEALYYSPAVCGAR